MGLINKIGSYIEQQKAAEIKPYDCQFSYTKGFIKMSDGRMAQVSVVLELDEDEWLNIPESIKEDKLY